MRNKLVFIALTILCVQPIYTQNIADTLSTKYLKEITIVGNQTTLLNSTQPLDIISSDAEYLSLNRGNSLMSSLEKIPGVNSMQIGQGFSKPMIRGLGFNRVAVLQNGIKQQGQQWGADHGLEIDQYDVDRLEIYKGATSLQFGSDAIAGALVINPSRLKEIDGYSANVLMNGASNNRLFGGSMDNHYQKDGKYVKARITYQNFEDYRIPARSFEYLGWRFPIHNKILKNTAGREQDISFQTGIIKEKFSSNILITNVYAKTGFFSGAHGIPTEIDLQDDSKYRNIGFPYQRVNHLKIIYNQTVKLNHRNEIAFDLGYQNNSRKEFALPHTHGTAIVPDTNLELALKLQTGSLNLNWVNQLTDKSKLTLGLNTEYQNNKIDGYSFLLPKFEQIVTGFYAINRLRLSNKIVLTTGARYDYGHLHTHEYIDSYLPSEYERRAENLRKNMGDVSFSGGIAYAINSMWNMKLNLGKSFRMATANELASNGVHHGTFRHELGNKNLKAEKSYQLDYSVEYRKKLDGFFDEILASTSLFTNYFPNFIFLNPTGEFSWLPDAGQYYEHKQSKALRSGGELELAVGFAKLFRLESSAEYVHAKDLESKYPIPFTPPFSLTNEFSAHINNTSIFTNNRLALLHRYTVAQNRVSRNELSTPAYNLFDFSASTAILLKNQTMTFVFQIQNLLDKKYYNHLSFYRYLDLPEIGRNFRLSIQMSIGSR